MWSHCDESANFATLVNPAASVVGWTIPRQQELPKEAFDFDRVQS